MLKHLKNFHSNQKGGVDTYIATTICLIILLLFLTAAFYVSNIYSKHNAMQRVMDLVIDDMKTYGGYTSITHRSVQNLLEGRGIPKDAVTLQANYASGGTIGAQPAPYGDSISVKLVYKFRVNLVGLIGNYIISVPSTSISQFVGGAVPDQCYIAPGSGLSLGIDNPGCSAWSTPVIVTPIDPTDPSAPSGSTTSPGGTDFLWE